MAVETISKGFVRRRRRQVQRAAQENKGREIAVGNRSISQEVTRRVGSKKIGVGQTREKEIEYGGRKQDSRGRK